MSIFYRILHMILWVCSINIVMMLSAHAQIPFALTSQQKDQLHHAFMEMEKLNKHEALLHADTLPDPHIKNMLLWHYFLEKGQDAPFEEISRFVEKHPNWPQIRLLRKHAERAISETDNSTRIIAWLRQFPPLTAYGKWMLANAYIKQSIYTMHSAEIQQLVHETWIEGNFSQALEQKFIHQYGTLLSTQLHIARTDHLLWKHYITQAERMMSRVPKRYQTLFKARIYLIRNRKGVDKVLRDIPSDLQQDPGLIYNRIEWRHRRKRFDGVVELLMDYTPPPQYADMLWPMIKRYARIALRRNEYQKAYQLVARHHQTDILHYTEAEWLAGWIALRKLNNPPHAMKHFYTMYKQVEFPISVARASYWLGRAYQAQGDRTLANKWFQEAAYYSSTFYGQLALANLDIRARIHLPSMPYITQQDARYMHHNPLVRMAYYWHLLGKKENSHRFLLAAEKQAPTHGVSALAAMFGSSYLGRKDLSIKIASRSLRKGIFITPMLYPIMPEFPGMLPIHPALASAIIRQESHFDSQAKSSAGAAGFMQLMPATAKLMSNKLHIRYSRRRLLRDPHYNIQLGSQYVAHLLDMHEGALVPSLAAYNAGPGNVRNWSHYLGHYTDMDTLEEKIDWIESIPFDETRNYVQRVLEGYTIYQARMMHKDTIVARDIVNAVMLKE